MTTDEVDPVPPAEIEPPVETPADGPVETAVESPRSQMSADQLAELEEERRFLLRSIADLDRERAAGDVDDADYHALRDGYTVRAATVLRTIDQGRARFAEKTPRNWKRIIGVAAAVALFGVVAGVLVARYSGQRDPGDVITGGTSPDQVARLLSEGSQLMTTGLYAEASNRYLSVLDIEPNNAEARTYEGWILANQSRSEVGAAAVTTLTSSKNFLQQGITLDPNYADPHCFLALIAAVIDEDRAEAATREAECRALQPSSDMQGLMIQFVDPFLDPSASSDPPSSDPTGTDDPTIGTIRPTATS